ncbi:hypothetical protein [Caldimonas brevitalea]|uniref:Membrane protein n=1 Tax=Caldimonas brevitalea TaxID=413882 RepID=A0A0G3BN07_9BURK|nr:hypothetical protein [Caldimonas brevitalea]AKJ30829.1 membrane protein [Caldimonas brevitalea]
MRTGAIVCTTLFVGWVALALVQLWTSALDGALFVKISLTLGALFVICLAVTLVAREVKSDNKLQKDGFID